MAQNKVFGRGGHHEPPRAAPRLKGLKLGNIGIKGPMANLLSAFKPSLGCLERPLGYVPAVLLLSPADT